MKDSKLDDVDDQEDLAQGLRAAEQQMARCTKVSFSHAHPIHQQWPMATNDVAIGHCWCVAFLKFFQIFKNFQFVKKGKLDDVQDEEDLAQGVVQRLK